MNGGSKMDMDRDEELERRVPLYLRDKGYTYEDWVDLRAEYSKPEYHDMPDRDDREEDEDKE
jgi:hypothetical protein